MTPSLSPFGRYAKLGPLLWLFALQHVVVENLVSLAWPFPYSRLHNYVSDLGAVNCTALGDDLAATAAPVCSPLHVYMNASFVVEGLLIIIGAVLMRRLFPTGKGAALALLCIALAGVGCVIAGLAPNDVNLTVHLAGAVLILFGGGVGLITLGFSQRGVSRHPKGAIAVTLACGALILVATMLFIGGVTLGLGVGGMERLAWYPIPLWLALAGAYGLRKARRKIA